MFRSLSLAALLAISTPSIVHAAPGHDAKPYGHAAPASQAKRTVTITMKDSLYEPKAVSVKAGEIVRFVVVNKGELLHEFALGRPEDHAEHQKMMAMMLEHGMITPTKIDQEKMKMPMGGGHDHGAASGSILVEPGKRGELTWKFAQTTTLQFACTIPGHYESGMVGEFRFQ